jgi:hypothetical protein
MKLLEAARGKSTATTAALVCLCFGCPDLGNSIPPLWGEEIYPLMLSLPFLKVPSVSQRDANDSKLNPYFISGGVNKF